MIKQSEWKHYTSGSPAGWNPIEPPKWIINALRSWKHADDDSKVYSCIVKGKNFDYQISIYGHGLTNISINSRERKKHR